MRCVEEVLEKEGVGKKIVISTYGLYSQSVKTDPMADLITVSVSSMLNSAVAVRALLLSVAMMVRCCVSLVVRDKGCCLCD